MLHDLGGHGLPIVLLHGLMGGPRTWRRVAQWLRPHGHVWAPTAPGHRGVEAPGVVEAGPWTTERFVEELAATVRVLGPAVVWGHSMGGLHGWCLAAEHPELVRGLVVEDMAPDFRGRTADGWAEHVRSWPLPFPDADAVRAFHGPVAGEYFLDALVPTADGWALHGDPANWVATAQHWGTREHWAQWSRVRCPTLLLEAEHSITPPGQVARMAAVAPDAVHLVVPGSGHLVHDEAPDLVRGAVQAFLDALP